MADISGPYSTVIAAIKDQGGFDGERKRLGTVEGLDAARRLERLAVAVAEFAVVALAEREDAAVGGQRQRVPPARVDGHFAHHVLRQRRDLLQRRHVVRVAQAQPTVAALAAGVHLHTENVDV